MDIVLNGVTLQGDYMDADFMEKFELSLRKCMETAAAKKREHFETVSAAFRAQCEVVNTCLDEIFGPGTAEAVFQGTANVREHFQAIQDLGTWAASERKSFNDFTNQYTQRQRATMQQAKTVQFVGPPHGHGKRKNRR